MKRLLIFFLIIASLSVYGQTSFTASDTTTIHFCVEFSTVAMPLNLMDVKYKDLPSVMCYKDKGSNVFHYSSGHFTNFVDASKHKDLLTSYGLFESHVVAIKNGRQIKLDDIPKYYKCK